MQLACPCRQHSTHTHTRPNGASIGVPGYWEVAADGGVFSFGGAPYAGSMGAASLSAPIAGMVASGSTGGAQSGAGGMLAGGAEGYCAVVATGGVDCWGLNVEGELGNGTADGYSDVPVAVIGITNAVSVAASLYGYCAVLATGGVDCWGSNRAGMLGNGSTSNYSDLPVPVSGITSAVSITSGESNYCVILSSGRVDCWGNNGGNNGTGELGADTLVSYSSVPVAVSGLTDVVSLTSYPGGYCAVLTTGGVDCWGDNSAGELGNGTISQLYGPYFNSAVPVAVTGVTNAVSINSNTASLCAVLSTGVVDCWGNNYWGLFGNGSTADVSLVPVAVGGVDNATSIVSASSGYGAAGYCAILETGLVKCWGSNEYGDLGAGVTAGVYSNVYYSSVPVAVSAITTKVVSAAQGPDGYCAVLSTGVVDCWGFNGQGQLGDGSQVPLSDVPVAVAGITNAVSIVSNWNGYCATLKTGVVYCWGLNLDGELGAGITASSSDVPVQVLGIRVAAQNPPPTNACGRQYVFVHGIHGDYAKYKSAINNSSVNGPNFASLLHSLHQLCPLEKNVHIFPYYHDIGYSILNGTAGPCRAGTPTANINVGPLYLDPGSTSGNICDGNSALALDATALNNYIALKEAQHPGEPITVLANSMGGAITRGWLRLAQAESPTDTTLASVDSVIFIEGAQQGSVWAGLGEQPATRAIYDIAARTPGLGSALKGLNMNVNEAGIKDLAPRSKWYNSVNSVAPPSNLAYFNFAANIHVTLVVNWFFGQSQIASENLGDYVMLPGSNSPTAEPLLGGEDFLPGGKNTPSVHQFLLNDAAGANYKIVINPLNAAIAAGLIAMGAIVGGPGGATIGGLLAIANFLPKPALSDPTDHFSLPSNTGNAKTFVPDCSGSGTETPTEAVLSIVVNPKDACQ